MGTIAEAPFCLFLLDAFGLFGIRPCSRRFAFALDANGHHDSVMRRGLWSNSRLVWNTMDRAKSGRILWRSRANQTLSRLCRCDNMLNVGHATVYESSVHVYYQALFNAAEGLTEKNQFDVWMLHAVVANDLCTGDSFVDLMSSRWLLLLPKIRRSLDMCTKF
ncbi:uncharacterized protein LOC119269697 isoform X2 [Triticum dicoccoides]|uniref:uncharacterized protein LOC119269697 isoform X2 n=1 Tax=Triticum dicoccoides TaxID=85692 RepID=UPI00188E0AEF|nr:uncharacterized protein LOC119269697 isoform X2 [Triticum dicoccoides]